MHAGPSVCVKDSVLLCMFVHTCREMLSLISPVAPLRGRGTGSLHSVSKVLDTYCTCTKQTHTQTHAHSCTGWLINCEFDARMWRIVSWSITESKKETFYLCKLLCDSSNKSLHGNLFYSFLVAAHVSLHPVRSHSMFAFVPVCCPRWDGGTEEEQFNYLQLQLFYQMKGGLR